jgi:hypothetical protein
MAEEKHMFTHKELVEMAIRKADVHDGKWMLIVNFEFAAINTGPSQDHILPTAIAAVQSIGIKRAVENASPSMVVDAAKVNPSEIPKKENTDPIGSHRRTTSRGARGRMRSKTVG